jgi:hypothetical protein
MEKLQGEWNWKTHPDDANSEGAAEPKPGTLKK